MLGRVSWGRERERERGRAALAGVLVSVWSLVCYIYLDGIGLDWEPKTRQDVPPPLFFLSSSQVLDTLNDTTNLLFFS